MLFLEKGPWKNEMQISFGHRPDPEEDMEDQSLESDLVESENQGGSTKKIDRDKQKELMTYGIPSIQRIK